MTTLLDQFGRPMSTTALVEPQTARVATLQHWTISTVIDVADAGLGGGGAASCGPR